MGAPASDERTAAEKFETLGLCSQLAEAAAALKWIAPSPIQEQAIPHLLQGLWPAPSWADAPLTCGSYRAALHDCHAQFRYILRCQRTDVRVIVGCYSRSSILVDHDVTHTWRLHSVS